MKKIGFVLLIIVITIGASLYYLWSQATSLPDWYKTGSGGSANGPVVIYGKEMEATRKQLERKIESQVRNTPTGSGHVEIALNESDANGLFASIVAESAEKHEYLKSIKASKISIIDGNFDIGVVVNTADIVRDVSRHGVEATGPNVINLPGFLQGKEIYLGFFGKYGLKNGKLSLDEDGKIRIGALTFSLDTILKRVGVSEERLRKTVKELEFGKLKINTIETVKSTLLLKGSLDKNQ